jgi:hypothetical protein
MRDGEENGGFLRTTFFATVELVRGTNPSYFPFSNCFDFFFTYRSVGLDWVLESGKSNVTEQ